jgi:hypothetical protein
LVLAASCAAGYVSFNKRCGERLRSGRKNKPAQLWGELVLMAAQIQRQFSPKAHQS